MEKWKIERTPPKNQLESAGEYGPYSGLHSSLHRWASRCKQIFNKRFINSASRRFRAARLAPTFGGARRLFSGSCFSVSTWGHQVAGVPKSRLLQLEQSAARTSGIRANGRCRFFTVCVAYSPRNHPIARILKEVFSVWLQVLAEVIRTSPEWYIRIRRAWTCNT